MLNPEEIRKDFPILNVNVHGKRLVYLDNAATSQKPNQVIDTLTAYYRNYNSNVHRGVHTLSIKATEQYESAREKIAKFINAPSDSLIYTKGTTDGINLVAHSWGLENIESGDEILLTEMEHHSNLVPWQILAEKNGATLKFIPVTESGALDLSQLNILLTSKTKLVAITQMSNVLGTINPVKEICRQAHALGAYMLIDAAQSVPHMPVDVEDIGCDFLAFSSHKMLGPTGIGCLYVRKAILETMNPVNHGGDMVKEVTLNRATWNDLPIRFEAGTPNIADAIALGTAIDYLTELGMDQVQAYEEHLTTYALDVLKGLSEDFIFYGIPDPTKRGAIISFYSPEIHPHDIGTVLDRQGIAIRAGHHCAMPLVNGRLGLPATARASFYIYNTEEEVDMLVESLKKTLQYFNR
ncbi:uncharacterized protein METZ01_LOCUS118407 [marine metagenome]|uniref:cysteine desulfurase n=1 Tax=marine metagenome TaxID=408172 RepID=A0A381XMT5_9ZZZZ